MELLHILLLLGLSVGVILVFQRLHIPTSLGYLLVGLVLGPHTAGPVLDADLVRNVAEFGIVFLLFAIGLNFSLPQIHALRHQVLGLGTAQVGLTTLVVGLLAWLAGLAPAAAFVVGAVFAQSSTTIISKQLQEQREDTTPHGRLGTAMSVFQDVTAVPFVVVIPVLGSAAGAAALGGALGIALAKALLAFALVFVVGRRVLRPLFHRVAERRSAEVFTLTVLFVSLTAAATTYSLGLSMAFGAFLAGMVLGETEFRHQVESAIRPFRDVLLGLFFVGIGMLFDPASLPAIWHWALLGAAVLLLSKILLVAAVVRRSGIDAAGAWRTALLLAVGGEFGFALLAIALDANVVDRHLAQILLTAVLFSMIAAPFLIRYNGAIAAGLTRKPEGSFDPQVPVATPEQVGARHGHVIVCGYGRIGQSVANFLDAEKIPFVALDLDVGRVREAHLAGEPVFYGDAAERDILEAVGIGDARLLAVCHDDVEAAQRLLAFARHCRPELPVMVRTRDEASVEALRAAGATEVVPETLEAGLMIASQALLLLDVPLARVLERMQSQRACHYRLLREIFRGDEAAAEAPASQALARLKPVLVEDDCPLLGTSPQALALGGVEVTALVRDGERLPANDPALRLQQGDAVVLFGSAADLERAEARLQG